MIIIFSGSIGRFPVGGHAWVDMQYLIGLRELGHDIYYLEECGEGSWVYNWETEETTTDLLYPTTYVRDCLLPIGFGSRWIYRAGDQSVGMAVDEFKSVCADADLLIVRACAIDLWREEYLWPKRRIFIDSDPGFTQLRLANGDPHFVNTVNCCERLFTIGQRIGAQDCRIPTVGRHWVRTVPPVTLVYWTWADDIPATNFSCVMQWRSYREITYKGVTYGNKDREFSKFIDLPKLSGQPFLIALTGEPTEDLSVNGWKILPGWKVSLTPESYRTFIRKSRSEFGVAKHGYIATQSGWFSDRSICYLASGRPVLVQDTGLSDWIPTGEGLLTFRDVPEALRGIETINAGYDQHRCAARQIAEEYFAAERVLSSLLAEAMC